MLDVLARGNSGNRLYNFRAQKVRTHPAHGQPQSAAIGNNESSLTSIYPSGNAWKALNAARDRSKFERANLNHLTKWQKSILEING